MADPSAPRLVYVADPMCSWCWGFAGVLATAEAQLRPEVTLELVLGGLAPDDDAPMSDSMRLYVQSAWRAVEERTGATFEHAFWSKHRPRRSTWPACRAVLVAEELSPGSGRAMFAAIQRAYYLETRDPSDRAVLAEVAREQGLDAQTFAARLDAPRIQERLEADFARRDALSITVYPSVALEHGDRTEVLTRGWTDAETFLELLRERGLLEE